MNITPVRTVSAIKSFTALPPARLTCHVPRLCLGTVTVTTPEYRHIPRAPRGCRVICHGRSPDLRVFAWLGPSRFPSGMCRTRSPLTVAGAVVEFHHVPFSPGLARTMTDFGVHPAGLHCKRCRSEAWHGK